MENSGNCSTRRSTSPMHSSRTALQTQKRAFVVHYGTTTLPQKTPIVVGKEENKKYQSIDPLSICRCICKETKRQMHRYLHAYFFYIFRKNTSIIRLPHSNDIRSNAITENAQNKFTHKRKSFRQNCRIVHLHVS